MKTSRQGQPTQAAPRSSGPRPDHESRSSSHDHLSLRLWLRLLACTNLIEAPLRSRLRQAFDGSLPRFDLMAQLDRHPQGLSMQELSKRLMVTGGNVTGLTDRLVAEGLVMRQVTANDRRRVTASLTSAGQRLFKTMARDHEGWVEDLFGGLSADEQAQLFDLLGRLKSTLVAPKTPVAPKHPEPSTTASRAPAKASVKQPKRRARR